MGNWLVQMVHVCVGLLIINGPHHVIRLQIGIPRLSNACILAVMIIQRPHSLVVSFALPVVIERPLAWFRKLLA